MELGEGGGLRMALRLGVAELLVVALALLAPAWVAGPPAGPASQAAARATDAPAGEPRSPGPTAPVARPPARHEAAMAYDPAHARVVLFGGDQGGKPFDDTWSWDGTRWKRESPAHSPSGRSGAALAFDSQQGTLVLFGGEDAAGRALDDTWTWNGGDWVAVRAPEAPPARRDAGLAYDASIGRLVLFGGTAGAGHLYDTWSWGAGGWSQVTGSGAPALDMPGSVLSYDARAGRVVLAGEAQTWGLLAGSWASLSGALPAGCAPASAAFDALLAAPVAVCASDPLGLALWTGQEWQPRPAEGAPPGRTGAQVAYDDKTSELVVFGGSAGGAFLDDTWTWTPGRGWSRS